MGRRSPDEHVLKRYGFDEKNIASIALIPIINRLPKDEKILTRQVTDMDGRPMTITMEGLKGLPTGIAGDVMLALINLYIEAGQPDDRTVVTTAYQLLISSGLPADKYYYDRLATILDQLKATQFVVSRWYRLTSDRYVKATFNIIDGLYSAFSNGKGIADNTTTFSIKLSDEVTDSIRAGYIIQLDMDVYHNLPTVGARGLYRLLDTYLRESTEFSENKKFTLQMNMLVWASNCGIIDRRADNVRQMLTTMSEPLVASKYLSDFTFVGRGKNTIISYEFNNSIPDILPENVAALVSHGVSYKQACQFAGKLGERVFQVVKTFEEQKNRRKVANSGAYLSTILRSEVLLQEAEQTGTVGITSEKRVKQSVASNAVLLEDPRESKLREATGAEAVALVFGTFKTNRLKGLGLLQLEIDALQQLLLVGRVSNAKMDQLVVQAFKPGLSNPLESLRMLLN